MESEQPDITILNLGAGVQSTCLYLMAANGETKNKPDVAIFSDTGWEPPEVYQHLERLKTVGEIPIRIVSHGNLRKDFLRTLNRWRNNKNRHNHHGQLPLYVKVSNEDSAAKGMAPDYGGTLWRKCTADYKIAPITKEIRKLLGYTKGQKVKKTAHQWFGISLDEIQRMRINQLKWTENIYPLVDMRMDRNACMRWLKGNGWDNVPKSACIGCPYHSDKQWRDMKLNKPDQWADAVTFDAELRSGEYPNATGDIFLHRQHVPLPDVDLSTPEDRGQLSFLDECEGMCGV